MGLACIDLLEHDQVIEIQSVHGDETQLVHVSDLSGNFAAALTRITYH